MLPRFLLRNHNLSDQAGVCQYTQKCAGKRFVAAIMTMMAVLVLGAVLSTPAYARSYTIPQVDIKASVTSSGDLDVIESRTFDFSGSFNGVYWADSLGPGMDINVASVLCTDSEGTHNMRLTDFDQSAENTAYLSRSSGGKDWKLKLYHKANNSKVTYTISYTISHAVVGHSDVAELYWKFVGPAWEVNSNNVKLTLTLPESVGADTSLKPGEDVHAYGHGQLTGNIAFTDGSIVYTLDHVSSGNFAEARVLFPLSLVPGVTPGTDAAYQSILDEEAHNAQETNQKRAIAMAFTYGRALIVTLICVGIMLLLFRKWMKFGKDFKPVFNDKYFRDVPSLDHPAVLGFVWRGKPSGEDFSASVLRLVDQGLVTLERTQTEVKSLLGSRIEDDYLIGLKSVPKDDFEHKIDLATMRVLEEIEGNTSRRSFLASEIDEKVKDNGEDVADAYQTWDDTVCIESANKKYFEEKGNHWRTTGLILTGVAALIFFFGDMLEDIRYPVVAACALMCFASIIVSFILSLLMKRRSQEAEEIQAKLHALKNWFNDFTALKEAPPTHVKVWKQLIVLATVLGVADKVVDHLKVALPEVVADPGFIPMVIITDPSFGTGSILNSLSTGAEFSKGSSSELGGGFSSLSGGGGGFSGGGGGGFGGGGGGAF